MKFQKKRSSEESGVSVVKSQKKPRLSDDIVSADNSSGVVEAGQKRKFDNRGHPGKPFNKFSGSFAQKRNGPWKGKNGQPFQQKPFEKPDWNKIKKDKRQLREKRKSSSKSQFSAFKDIKAIWEKIRRHDCPADERSKLCEDLMKLVEGNLVAVIRSHDISRVVQCLIKFGSNDMRVKIVDELTNEILTLARCKYSVHLVRSLFRHSPSASRRKIVDKLCGSVLKLLRSKISCNLADEIYVKFATNDEKAKMKKEFYGNLLTATDEKNLASLNDEDNTKMAVLSTTKSILRKLTDKTNCLSSRLVQSVLYDFLSNCSESDRKEMLEDLKPHLGMLLESREGAMVAGLVLRQSSNKEKKTFVKELKSKPLTDCHSLVLMTLFDTVDDTVLLKKALIPEIFKHLEELVKCKFGQKVIIYLIAHRDPTFFHPRDIEWLKESETSSLAKKDPEVRMRELQEAVVQPLSEFICNHTKLCLSSSQICIFTLGVVKKLTGDYLKSAYESLSSYIIEQSTAKTDFPSIVEDPGVHTFLRQLIKHDSSAKNGYSMVECLLPKITTEVLVEWLQTNRGRFLVIKLVESNTESAVEALRPVVTKEFKEALKKCPAGESTDLLRNILKTNKLIK